jgi:hypothetical protein
MTSIVALIVVILGILSVFLYFFVLEDKKSVQDFLQKFKKNTSPYVEKKSVIDTSIFEKGLSEVRFHNDVLKHVKNELHKKIV